MHGAGYANSGRFGTRHPDYLERTLAGKLDGAVGLMALTRHDPVRYFLAFGSIGGRFGANGLSDYAAANDMLAKLCDWHRVQTPSCAVCCMHWQSWDEIGMAMLGDSAVGTKGILKMAFIPPKEGVEHLCRELEAGLPTNEVVITDGFFEKTFYPFAVAAETSADSIEIERAPLVERIAGDGQSVRAEIELDPEVDPFLIDHKLRGRPILPAVAGLEAMVEAAVLTGGGSVVAVRDLELVEGLLFRSPRKIAASVKVTRQPDGTFGCELLSDLCNQAGKLIKKDRLHARVTVELGQRKPLEATMSEPVGPLQKFVFANSESMVHGPTLQGLEAIGCDATGGWAQLRALSLRKLGGARRGHDWLVPATILDAAFYACGVHTWVHIDQVVALPSALELARFDRMPRENEKCLVDFTCREVQDRNAIYDFTVFGEDRAPILAVTGYRIVMIK